MTIAIDYDLPTQMKCVEREIGMRLAVYARRVADGKMKQDKADQEIACMQAVLESLHRLKELEK